MKIITLLITLAYAMDKAAPDDVSRITNTLTSTSDSGDADKAIAANVITQLCMGMGIVALFLFVRKRAPYLYYPNSELRPNHPCYKYNGVFNWFLPVISIEDAKLLGMTGLDGFMLLQTLKLLYRFFFLLSLVYVPVLCTSYYINNGTRPDTLFARLSIKGVGKTWIYTLCIVLVYITTILIFYILFIYYKRYVTLRQIYLVSPASLTSVETLKALSKQLSSYENSVEFINMSSKTVILNRLPSYLKSDQDVYDYVKELGIGDVRNAILIQDTYCLTKLYEKRDIILQNIEKEIHRAFVKIKKHFRTQTEEVKGSFRETFRGTLEMSADHVFTNMKFSIEEKVRLLNLFIQNGNKFLELAGDDTSYLIVYIEQLRYCNQKILEEKEKLSKMKDPTCEIDLNDAEIGPKTQADAAKSNGRPGNTPNRTPSISNIDRINYHEISIHNEDENIDKEVIEKGAVQMHRGTNNLPDVSQSMFIKTNLDEDVSFFSFKQIKNYSKYKNYFSLDLPTNKQRAFVTFGDAKQSGLIKQSQIGTRVFSPVAEASPAPNDIIWKNLTRTEVSCFFGKLGSLVMFIGYNILFYFTVSSLVRMLDLSGSDNIVLLSTIKKSPLLAAYYNGAITPAVYNLCITLSPFIISFLINLEGVKSFSLSQIRLMKLYSIFLFYNAFLSIFFSNSFFSIINNFLKDSNYKLDNLLNDLGKGYSEYSLFFMNTVIQRMIVGSLLTLLKPGPFFINFVVYHFQKRTRRMEEELHLSAPFDFGNAMPQVMLIFPIALSYACVCPIMVLLGFFYYYINYFVYKNELVYSQRNSYESGGIFWTETSLFLMLGVVAFQLSTVAALFAENYGNLILITVPLVILDIYFYDALRSLFNKNVKNYPLNEPEEEFLDEFSTKFIEERRAMLENWEEEEDAEDEDLFPITELGLHDRNIVTNTSHYKDPSTAIHISHIMLPSKFYRGVHFLRTFDFKNVYGFNLDASTYNHDSEDI